MGYASIVFGALALLLLPVSFGMGLGVLELAVAIAAAIIGAILGAMSRATKQGKAGLILSLVSLFLTALLIAYLISFAPRSVTITPNPAVETSPAK
jgi:hypothetical protein